MTASISLTAEDGFEFTGQLAEPEGKPVAGLVVLQEIFGVTGHIQQVTERFAEAGYLAVAPSLFDRAQPGIVLDYADVTKGRDIMMSLDIEQCVLDMGAAADAVRTAGKVGVIGYCWGGAMADLAAGRVEIDAAVSYYGGRIASWLDIKPQCPVMYHFGETDPLIPADVVEQIRGGRPDGELFVYPEAGHGFNCDERPDFHPTSAALALRRTKEFFAQHLHG